MRMHPLHQIGRFLAWYARGWEPLTPYTPQELQQQRDFALSEQLRYETVQDGWTAIELADERNRYNAMLRDCAPNVWKLELDSAGGFELTHNDGSVHYYAPATDVVTGWPMYVLSTVKPAPNPADAMREPLGLKGLTPHGWIPGCLDSSNPNGCEE